MKTQESEEDLLCITSNSGENSEQIPVDLIFEIFLRLSAKTIARCSCVSKRWDSIIRLPLFTNLFLTRSLARPKLLFSCHKDGHVFFFSSPQPQSPDENLSLLAAKCYCVKIPDDISFDIRVSSIRGLFFLRIDRVLKIPSVIWNPSTVHESVIFNPSTGQSLTLPQVKSRSGTGIKSYFGYDLIEKQYKVLSVTWVISTRLTVCDEYQVLTLGGTGEPSWRKIECPIPHHPPYEYHHICINGILYYPTFHSSLRDYIIVCFDVRSEKFKFVKSSHYFASALFASHLINYNGKLASLQFYQTCCLNERLLGVKLWVLEDAEKQEWSEHTYDLPALRNSFVGDSALRVVGMTRTSEIALSSSKQSGSYYVFYYNTERNTITRVDIQGMEELKHNKVYTFLDHVEDVKRL